MSADDILPELEFLTGLLEQAPGFVTVFLGREHRYAFMNKGMAAMMRGGNVVGLTLDEVGPSSIRDAIAGRLNKVWSTGEPFMSTALPYYIYDDRIKDFSIRYGDFLHQPIKNKDGEVIGVYVQGIDVTDRKLAQENLAFLKHQSINLVRDIIAMIKNSVDQVLEKAENLKAAHYEVERKFDLLVKVQTAFLNNDITNRSLHTIIRNALSVMMPDAQAIEINGQPIELGINYQSPLVLLVQEMARNAINQHIGAEKIKISWQTRDRNMLSIAWQERMVDLTNHHMPSLDSSVVKRLISLNPHNKVKSTTRPQSVEYVLDLCLEDVA